MLTVCFHGAESTGKSVMAARLNQRFGWPVVAEFGREYCETHGTDLVMADLLAIAEGHMAATQAAARARPEVLILDTDQLMTAAWAQMLFEEVPGALLGYAKADLYLLFEPDVPWVADGTRFFGESDERGQFAALAQSMLVLAGVRWERIFGSWADRETQILAAIAAAASPNP
ncbi:MAG: N-acetylglucosamine-6-phosphate deacetylase [Novosphingobium sp. 16-62-11]|uniref:ATP-binding protein n=1 Tax=Novosphingobium sp. 17-62-19 TaxID=1970406 RepID=UPI000BC8BF3E|nr:ATP-binding protein [Novosphingobium sp. 17-62-19]OYX96158.1 MAG: N-acetylglucosamine-6-phosphate deacetylase [Novosphingobium sp. 35-62-5]OYZ47026.1 MAG: N-acetylglucosamine-6-phosphate deacetylase [Novosphingobium sp. 16-62-11]OZA16620.1 MAG: N-acetylglucosamine-6-phosphate deacetylase [Novosphingobium sp. 17-62-19]HQS98064.1 ATP-binding protein [Novosphingobium sp.]